MSTFILHFHIAMNVYSIALLEIVYVKKDSPVIFDIFYRALNLTLPYAGTLLAFDPVTDSRQYRRYDLAFRGVCCGTEGGCDLFLERRPINDCRNYREPSMCKNELCAHLLNHIQHQCFLNVSMIYYRLYIICRSWNWRSSLQNNRWKIL